MSHLLKVADLARTDVDALLDQALALASSPAAAPTPTGKLIVLAFFQDSVRTRVGFTAAAARLGVATTVVAGVRYGPTMSGGESLPDTARTLGAYCDAILLRHPDSDAPSIAAELAGVPVINCGNGHDEHPTQALIDLLAIRDARGTIDGTRIGIAGDLRHMRAVHSLLHALALYDDVHVRLISPPELKAPPETLPPGAVETGALDLEELDIVYMAGFAPRTPVGDFDDQTRSRFALTTERARRLDPAVRILCPMPRIDEIEPGVDALPQAHYFRQSALGLPMRMAVLQRVLGL
jgi:aspartate carbamoyltransferase catalytic subunit